MRTADFARRAGVTVRTLHYYDRVGLLCPSRTLAGHRVYAESDLLRLQQIRVLQLVGLSLEQIRRLLDEPRDVGQSLQFQLRVLREKQRQLDRVIHILDEAVASNVDLALIIRRIEKESTMEWTRQFYDEDTWKKLQDRASRYSPDRQAQDQQRWQTLMTEIRQSLSDDPASPKVQALAHRWKALIDEFTEGDPRVLKGLRDMYQSHSGPPGMPSNDDVKAFMVLAMKAGGLTFDGS